MRWLAVVTLGTLTGCAGFFPSNSSTTSTSSTGAIGGDYVYALNPTMNSLSGYAVGTGSLTAVSGSPYSLVSGLTSASIPGAIAVSGLDTFVYVSGNGAVYGYSIGTGGALTALSSGAALASVNLSSMDCSPDGNWLVGLDNSVGTLGQIDLYQINPKTGLLTASTTVTPSAAYSGTKTPKMVRFSPLANYIVAALGTAGNALFSFNTSSGAVANLAAVNPTTSSVGYNAVAINKADTQLYMTSTGYNGSALQNGVLSYALSGASGETGGATLYPGGAGANSIVLDSTGGFLYVGNFTDGTISEYSFVGGAPTQLSGSPLSVGSSVASLARDNSGNYILVGLAGVTTDLAMYGKSATTTGTLTNVANAATSSTTNDAAGLLIATTH